MNSQTLIARRQKTLGPTYRKFYREPLRPVRVSDSALDGLSL